MTSPRRTQAWRSAACVAVATTLALCAGLSQAGCIADRGFQCSSSAQCEQAGRAGRCEQAGYCSFADETCDSGYRFGSHAGSYSGMCVGGGPADLATPGDDAAVGDLAPTPDATPPPPPDLGANDLSPGNIGPGSDVAEDVTNTWDVGDSTDGNVVPCMPIKHNAPKLFGDTMKVHTGAQSVRAESTSSHRFQATYPKAANAKWDLTTRTGVNFWIDAVVPPGYGPWEKPSPVVVLCGANGAYRRLDQQATLLEIPSKGFVEVKLPLAGGGTWTFTDSNGFSLSEVNSIEFHVNPTQGNATAGTAQLWLDGVAFY